MGKLTKTTPARNNILEWVVCGAANNWNRHST